MNRDFREELRRREKWAKQLKPKIPKATSAAPRIKLPAEQMLRTFVQWSDAFDEPAPSLLSLVRLIRRFSGHNILEVLGRTNLLQYHNSLEGIATQVSPALFPPGVGERIVNRHKGNPTSFISRSTIFYLEMLTLRFGNFGETKLFKDEPLAFGRILLAAAEFSEGPITGKVKLGAETEIKGYFYSNYLLNKTADLASRVGRYWSFLSSYSKHLAPQHDVAATISKATGQSAVTQAALVFAAISKYLAYKPAEFSKEPGAFLTPITYFDTAAPGINNSGRALLTTLSREQPDFRATLKAERYPKSAYNCRSIFDTPFYKVQDVMWPLDIAFLADQGGFGLYFRAYSELRKTKNHIQFAESWGRVFEHHIAELLKHEMPDMLGKRLFIESVHGFENCDFIIRDGENLIFLEATIASVPALRGLSVDWIQIKKSIDTILFEREHGHSGKAFQLASAIKRFRSGEIVIPGIDPKQIKNIFPVLVLEHGIPQIPMVVDDLRSEILAKTGMAEAARFEFWDIDELELIAPLFRERLSDLIEQKSSSAYRTFPMKNYISAVAPDLRRSDYMQRLWASACSDIETLLFPKKAAN